MPVIRFYDQDISFLGTDGLAVHDPINSLVEKIEYLCLYLMIMDFSAFSRRDFDLLYKRARDMKIRLIQEQFLAISFLIIPRDILSKKKLHTVI